MGEFCSVRVWQLKPDASAADFETLAATGFAEMHRWIPGVKQLSLVRQPHATGMRYLVITTFINIEAYNYWRLVEEEGQDYWERYASVMMHWEQLVRLVEEYSGDYLPLQEQNAL
ncbi:MAG TPA: hypothetical protein VFA41_10990 [Ktedonobacteraceae bacterium]|jgi:heme-degrading monooxygenase HmoA|nr:hypothetical protein [Ktedonobacteraceae bacterium]